MYEDRCAGTSQHSFQILKKFSRILIACIRILGQALIDHFLNRIAGRSDQGTNSRHSFVAVHSEYFDG